MKFKINDTLFDELIEKNMKNKSIISEGCLKMFSEKQGWVGRPYKYPCVKGNLCPDCKKNKEGVGE